MIDLEIYDELFESGYSGFIYVVLIGECEVVPLVALIPYSSFEKN